MALQTCEVAWCLYAGKIGENLQNICKNKWILVPVYISKMWESWFALANSTMFGSDGQAKYDHVMVATQYQALSRLRVHCRFRCQPCVL